MPKTHADSSIDNAAPSLEASAISPTVMNSAALQKNLLVYAASDHVHALRALLHELREREIRINDVKDEQFDDNRPQHWASLAGKLPAMESLAEAGADFRLVNRLGTPALFDAGRSNVPEALLFALKQTGSAALYDSNGAGLRLGHHLAYYHCDKTLRAFLEQTDGDGLKQRAMPCAKGYMMRDLMELRMLEMQTVAMAAGHSFSRDDFPDYLASRATLDMHEAPHSALWLSQNDTERLRHDGVNHGIWRRYVKNKETQALEKGRSFYSPGN